MKTHVLTIHLARSTTLLLALAIGHCAFAGQIRNVTVSAVSLEYYNLNTSNPDRRVAANVVSDAGLFGDIHTTLPGGTMWLAANPAGTAGAANANAGTNFIVFDLGAIHTVDAMKVWNYNENNAAGTAPGTNQGVKLADISYSVDGVSFTTNLPNQLFNLAPGLYTNFAQTIPMGGVTARYICVNVRTNWHTTANKPVGLSKVRFIDNTTPPLLLGATRNYGSNQVTVVFSEPVDPASAADAANYTLQSGGHPAAILSAAMGSFSDRVVLQTTPLTNQNYTLTASGIYDQERVITITNNSSAAVTPELILWLRADAGVSTDDLGNVTQWSDQSGYGHHALNTLTVNQYSAPPTLYPGIANGQPAVNFNGAQLLNIPHDDNLALNGDMTVCLVFNKSSAALGDPISKTGGQGMPYTGTPKYGYTNNMPAPFDFQLNASQKPVFVWGNGGAAGGGITVLTGPTINFGEFYIISMVARGTNLSCYLNGSLAASARTLAAPVDAGNPMMLGVRLDSGNVGDAGATFNGNLAEAMVIRGSLTPADMVAIHNYLGPKYGITIVGLGIAEQPRDTVAEEGKQATFWVNATGVPPLTYQWRSNNVVISGATKASYTTPPLTAAANGASYSVTVTTPVGATNSTLAVLTVTPDNTPPTLFSVARTGNPTNLVVAFSEAVGLNALDPASYSLNGGAAVVSAAYGSASNQIVLGITELTSDGYFLTARNVRDEFGNTLIPATAPVLPSGLALFLRADSGVVRDDTGAVVRWLDQSANANHTAQFGSPSTRPGFGPNAINGKPALTFNSAAGSYLEAASSPSLAITGDVSIVAVANFADYNTPREILGKTVGNQPASYDYYISSPTDFRLYRGNGVGANAVGRATAAPGVGTPHVIAVRMSGTNVAHFLDGLANGSATAVTEQADRGTPLRIGARDDLTQFMNGDIAELMLFSSAIFSTQRREVDNYLGVKYFPFNITRQPAPVTTPQGVSVTFSAAATQGSAHFQYQWRENGLPILDATNASYSTPILAPGDTGKSFDVVFIVPGLSTNFSAPALLTVQNVPPAITSTGIPIWSGTNVVIVFSEAVDPATATLAANYSLDNGATVLAAAMGVLPNQVVLTTSALAPGTAYQLTARNVKDLFNNTLVAVTLPLGLYPEGLSLWLKADAGVTAGGGLVGQWDDQSGHGNNLIAGFQPLLVPDAVNGRPAVRFDGATTYMYAYSSPSLEITGDLSIFAVATFSNLTSNTDGMIVSKTLVNIPAPFDYYVRAAGVQLYRGNGTTYGYSQGSTLPSEHIPHVLGVVMRDTSVTHRLDGLPNGSGSIATPIVDQGEPLFIGTREDNTNHLNGDLAELVIFNAALSTNDIAALERYFGAKYALPIGLPPTLTIQPQGNGVVRLEWSSGVLQSADQVTGPYVDVPNATSPYVIPTSHAAQFYLLRKP